jgi:hypothetical protein
MDESTLDEFWNLTIALSLRVSSFPTAFGLLTAVSELAQKQHGISPLFLAFLSDRSRPNNFLKPFLLVALYDHLPDLFLITSSDYFLPLIVSSFLNDNYTHHTTLFMMLGHLRPSLDILHSFTGFFDGLWRFIYRTAQGRNFGQLSSSLAHWHSEFTAFFSCENLVLDGAIAKVAEFSDFVPLIRLMPFFGGDRFAVFFPKLLAFTHNNLLQAIQFEDIVDDSANQFGEEEATALGALLVHNMKAGDDCASLLLLSLYAPAVSDYVKHFDSIVVQAVAFELSSPTSCKEVVCFLVGCNAERFLSHRIAVRYSVVPSLLSLLADADLSKFAAKAFNELVDSVAVEPRRLLDPLLEMGPSLVSNFQTAKYFFKVLGHMIDRDADFDYELLHQFCCDLLADPSVCLGSKAFALSVVSDVRIEKPELAESSTELCQSVSLDLLECESGFVFPILTRYLSLFAATIDSAPFEATLVGICLGNPVCTPKEQGIVIHYVAVMCSRIDRPFPSEVMQRLLTETDERFHIRAIVVLRHVLKNLPDVHDVFHQCVEIAKVSQSAKLVNEMLLTAMEYLAEFGEVSEDIDQLVFGILQGRFALLEHSMTFDYDFEKFKFYKFVTQYVRTYRMRSAPVVRELVDWIDAISDSLLPKLVVPINVSIAFDVVDERLAGRLWNIALDRLRHESDHSLISGSLLALLVNVRCCQRSVCNLEELMEFLRFMWQEAEDADDEILSFLPEAFLDLAVNEEAPIPVGPDILERILELMGERRFDWRYAKMVNEVMVLLNEKGEIYNVWFSAAKMFAQFLTLSPEEQGGLRFDVGAMAKMGQMLNRCIGEAEVDVEAIRAQYAMFPAKLNRLDIAMDCAEME